MNLYLIGYRCSGKTAVGQELSRRLKRPFIDADQRIAAAVGDSIADFVAKSGWEAFREKEQEILAELSKTPNLVIATGGGVVIRKQNIANMKKTGRIIWLRARPKTVKRRMLADDATPDSRPWLTAKGRLEEIEEVLCQREPLYQKAADMGIDTDDIAVESVVDRIIKMLNDF